MNGILASMDDEALYGKNLYTYTFSKAVKNELLVPYKIIILGVNEEEVSESIQHLMIDENYELTLDDKTKIIGCYQALSKIDLKVDLSDDPNPMRRALAFVEILRPLNVSVIHSILQKYRKNCLIFISFIKRPHLFSVPLRILMEHKVPRSAMKPLIG